jgi:hypothetical protein
MTKQFYRFDTPSKPAAFARFAALGSWKSAEICKTCGQHGSEYAEPLLVEWEPGTDVIGDFSWGGSACIVKDSVKDFLNQHGFNTSFSTAIEYQKFKWTERLGGRHKRVKYPYEGPNLSWLRAIDRVEIDIEKSNIDRQPDCRTCGRLRIQVRRDGLHINDKSWNGEKLFSVKQFSKSGMFISEEALQELQDQGFTNFAASLAGLIGD